MTYATGSFVNMGYRINSWLFLPVQIQQLTTLEAIPCNNPVSMQEPGIAVLVCEICILSAPLKPLCKALNKQDPWTHVSITIYPQQGWMLLCFKQCLCLTQSYANLFLPAGPGCSEVPSSGPSGRGQWRLGRVVSERTCSANGRIKCHPLACQGTRCI